MSIFKVNKEQLKPARSVAFDEYKQDTISFISEGNNPEGFFSRLIATVHTGQILFPEDYKAADERNERVLSNLFPGAVEVEMKKVIPLDKEVQKMLLDGVDESIADVEKERKMHDKIVDLKNVIGGALEKAGELDMEEENRVNKVISENRERFVKRIEILKQVKKWFIATFEAQK